MDKASFADYWNEAVLALIYDIHQLKKPIRETDINRCWRRELLDCRFFSTGIRHGAAAWLQALDAEEPAKAAALREALSTSTFHIGTNSSQVGLGLAGAAATAAGGWMLSQLHGTAAKAGGVATGLLGIGMMAKSGADLCAMSDTEHLCCLLRKEADRQREMLMALL